MFEDILSSLGIDSKKISKLPTIKELEKGKKFFVSYEDIYIVIEPAGQEHQNYLIFLDLTSRKYYSNYGEHAKVEIYKKSENDYVLIEPISNINDVFIGEKKELSPEFLKKIIESLANYNKDNLFQANPYAYSPEEGKESNEIYEKFFSINYEFLWGSRKLKESEKAKILLSSGIYESKKPDSKITGKEILVKLRKKLALQKKVVNILFNELNIHQILSGKKPVNGGIVLYGPGGTGKTTIMKIISEIFEEIGAYVAKNDKNEFLKTSEVKDTKYYGAYTDYFEPKFAKAHQEARIRGIPSLIPIDEGDIFIEKQKKDKENAHSSDMLNFWKGHIGNHYEFIVIVATNVIKSDLNPIAVRAERAVAVEIPLPDIYIAKNLIKQFIREFEIELDEKLTDEELSDLAKIVVDSRKPGADIAKFCKTYYSNITNYTNLYNSGKSTEEINEIEMKLRKKSSNKKEFIKRFKEEFLKENFSSNEDDEDLTYDNEINVILNDKDTKRIILAEKGYQVLGVEISGNLEETYLISILRVLRNKFQAQGGKGYKFAGKTIHSKKAILLLTEIVKVINSVDINNLGKEVPNINFNLD